MTPQLKAISANHTALRLSVGTLHFSYETLIAITGTRLGDIVAANAWGSTTGRHLNEIDGGSARAKSQRLDLDEFYDRASDVLAALTP